MLEETASLDLSTVVDVSRAPAPCPLDSLVAGPASIRPPAAGGLLAHPLLRWSAGNLSGCTSNTVQSSSNTVQVLIAWNRNTIVLSFRGTASLVNALADIQASTAPAAGGTTGQLLTAQLYGP